jgi:PAS domain S-box-containing protein
MLHGYFGGHDFPDEDAGSLRESPRELRATRLRSMEAGEVPPRESMMAPELLREINERLVLATLRAQELAEDAEAARAMAALSERRFRSLVDSIAAIVLSADTTGWIRFDPRWHVLTGLAAIEPPGRWDWLEAVHAADRDRVRQEWMAAIATGTIYESEHRLYRRDRSIAWVAARAVPIRDEGGRIVEWMGLMADITDRKLVEEARERFIGVLGHDLRTPLTALKMGAEHLFDSPELHPSLLGAVGIMRRCSARMQQMIVDVLDFTRGRLGGGIPVSPRAADFGSACRDVVAELSTIHPGRQILIETSGDLQGEWDLSRVQQVVSNLVGNALEHGQDPVQVTVTGELDDVVLAVQNRNLDRPVPTALLPLLFEPFRRGDARDDSTGLGLGLYIVSQIVHAHGGTIAVTSTEAEGTTFTSRWSRHRPLSSLTPVR